MSEPTLCKDCITGVVWDDQGSPEGKFEEIGGIRTYVATPAGDYAKHKVILYLSDAFGPELINPKLLADDFARHGFRTVVPDLFNGDSIPAGTMLFGPDIEFPLPAWVKKHGPAMTRPIIDALLEGLKAQGVTEIGGSGYCFGARYVFDLAYDHLLKASVISHPSLLKIPEDLEKYCKEVTAPLLINSCDVDQMFPPEARTKADEVFGNGKFAPGYKREHWDGCKHGFAVRGDVRDPLVKAGKEGSFKATVEWFKKYL